MVTDETISNIVSSQKEAGNDPDRITEIGTACFDTGIKVTYSSRTAYDRHPPVSSHTIQWKRYNPPQAAGKSPEVLEKEKSASPPSPPIMTDEQWVEIIASQSPLESPLSQEIKWNNTASFLTAEAEKIRGITTFPIQITINNTTKSVLMRNAIKAKETLTHEELTKISHFEFLALWSASISAADKMADSLEDDHKKSKLKNELNKLIDVNIPDVNIEHGKDIYLRKMQSLFSVLGAFYPGQSPETLSEWLEAERDLLAIEHPTDIVATYHLNGDVDSEYVYKVEIPNTKLSEDQKKFFALAMKCDTEDNEITETYDFFRHLKPWQQKLIHREAPNILQENRLRPTQLQFLPMAPNFWTKYTAVKSKSNNITIVNEITRCGALSPRIEASEAGLIQFHQMQYSQVRAHFGMNSGDKLCYTSYKQNFYGPGTDDSALKNITIAHDDKNNPQFAMDNHIYNIPFGRFSPLSRIMNITHNFFFENKFENNKDDPLIHEAYSAVELILNLRNCRDRDNPLPLDAFLNATLDFGYGTIITSETESLIDEIKLDLETIYRHVNEIERLRHYSIIQPNLRIATLRTVLFDELKKVKAKCEKLPDRMYKPHGTRSFKVTFKAYISGCKSNIDRGTLVAHHAEVMALKEHRRRSYWNTTFTTPTAQIPWLNTKSFLVKLLLKTPVIGSIVNFFTTLYLGSSLKKLHEKYTLAIMERDVAAIDDAMTLNKSMFNLATHTGKIDYQRAQAPLLKKRVALINEAIEANVSIEAAVCQSGHSRIMPAHGGSEYVSGIKDDVIEAVAPHLQEHYVHLCSQRGLSGHNHHLHEKSDINGRHWVKEEHREAARETYTPPPLIEIESDQQNQINNKVEKKGLLNFSYSSNNDSSNSNPNSNNNHNININ